MLEQPQQNIPKEQQSEQEREQEREQQARAVEAVCTYFLEKETPQLLDRYECDDALPQERAAKTENLMHLQKITQDSHAFLQRSEELLTNDSIMQAPRDLFQQHEQETALAELEAFIVAATFFREKTTEDMTSTVKPTSTQQHQYHFNILKTQQIIRHILDDIATRLTEILKKEKQSPQNHSESEQEMHGNVDETIQRLITQIRQPDDSNKDL